MGPLGVMRSAAGSAWVSSRSCRPSNSAAARRWVDTCCVAKAAARIRCPTTRALWRVSRYGECEKAKASCCLELEPALAALSSPFLRTTWVRSSSHSWLNPTQEISMLDSYSAPPRRFVACVPARGPVYRRLRRLARTRWLRSRERSPLPEGGGSPGLVRPSQGWRVGRCRCRHAAGIWPPLSSLSLSAIQRRRHGVPRALRREVVPPTPGSTRRLQGPRGRRR